MPPHESTFEFNYTWTLNHRIGMFCLILFFLRVVGFLLLWFLFHLFIISVFVFVYVLVSFHFHLFQLFQHADRPRNTHTHAHIRVTNCACMRSRITHFFKPTYDSKYNINIFTHECTSENTIIYEYISLKICNSI